MTASDPVRETGLTAASLSVVVEKLVIRGFLRRERDRTDRRRRILSANAAMIAGVDAVYEAHARRVDRLLTSYTETEFDTVIRFMAQFSDELRNTVVQFTNERRSRGGRPSDPAALTPDA